MFLLHVYVFYLQIFQVVQAWRNFLQFIVVQMNFSDFGNASETSILHILDLIEVKPQPVKGKLILCSVFVHKRE